MSNIAFPSLFVCHGGGPMPLIKNPPMNHDVLIGAWKKPTKEVIALCGRPKAILLVSAHYQTRVPSIGSAAQPKMMYDYYGFPKETYDVQYKAPGAPDVSKRALELLRTAGLEAQDDPTRAYDHGVFVPLLLMFPEADIPVVPVSVLTSEDPAEHVKMGEALAPLRSEGVFIIGSGASVHNFGYRGSGSGKTFNDRLSAVLTDAQLPFAERVAELGRFLTWPKVDEAQARGATEHLSPLFTAFGAGGRNGKAVVAFRGDMPGLSGRWDLAHYWFGEAAVVDKLAA